MANSVDPDQTPLLRRLIWVYTVCSGLSVPIGRFITVCVFISMFSLRSRSDLNLRKFKFFSKIYILLILPFHKTHACLLLTFYPWTDFSAYYPSTRNVAKRSFDYCGDVEYVTPLNFFFLKNRIIALILINIVPSWDIEGTSLRVFNIHQYQCNNPFIV